MEKNVQKLIEILGKERVGIHEPLWKYSSLHIGGPADLFFRAKKQKDLIQGVNAARKLSIPFFILGGGTNILIGDKGFRGLVIKNETNLIKLVRIYGGKKQSEGGNTAKVHTVYLEVETGVGVNRLVRFTIEQGLAGLEVFLGQPGSVGGAVYINAHNMRLGKFIGDAIYGAKLLNKAGSIVEVPHTYFKFGYDRSSIQESEDIVLSVLFKLEVGNKDQLWQKAQSVLEYRRQTQPQGVFSAGCTFRNISKSDAVRIAAPDYTQSAGFLLDSLGLKGEKRGNACFSPEHANFITHKGQAKACDMLELINLAKKNVKDKYGIILQEEIVQVGDF